MKPHIKIYFNFFGYQLQEDCVCEICGGPAVDVHHIDARGMGGDPQGNKDKIENLMAVCRNDHNEYGDIEELKPMLRKVHLKFMEQHAPVAFKNWQITQKNGIENI